MATATETNLVEAQARAPEARGKNHARRLRVSGQIPAIVYGAKKPAVPVSVDPKAIGKILHSEAGHNTIFDLQVGSEKAKVMIVDWQYEPIKGKLMHIDMKRIAMDQRLKVKVPIQLKGEAAGVKQQGGILEQMLREVELECLPDDIPSHLEFDVSELVFGQVVRVSDLPRGEKLTLITDPNQPVVHITTVKEEVVATPDAVAAEAAAVPAEPEVIKKGKQEAEEGAAAEAGEVKAEKKEAKPEKTEKKEKK